MKNKQKIISAILAIVLACSFPVFASAAVVESPLSEESVIPDEILVTDEEREKAVRPIDDFEEYDNVLAYENDDGTATAYFFPGDIQSAIEQNITASLSPVNCEFIQECAVYSNFPNTAFAYEDSFTIGKSEYYGKGRLFIQPSLGFLDDINVSEISSVMLNLYDMPGESNDYNYYVYEIMQPWDKFETTFASQPTCSTTPISVFTANGVNDQWCRANITNVAKNWLTTGVWNGVMVASAFENSNYYTIFQGSINFFDMFAPYMSVTYYPREELDWGNMTESNARGAFLEGDNIHISFTVTETAEYLFETAVPSCLRSSMSQDTGIYLFNSSGSLRAYNKDIGENCKYSRIKCTLTPGTYRIWLTRYTASGTERPYGFHSYFSMWQKGTVSIHFNTFGETTYEDELPTIGCITQRIADICDNYRCYGDVASNLDRLNYNCHAYALGITNQWILCPDSYDEYIAMMASYGYELTSEVTDNCIVAYSDITRPYFNIQHMERIDNGIVTSKLGQHDLVQMDHYNSYYPTSTYGVPQYYFVRTTNT